jgi:hypothetical protein
MDVREQPEGGRSGSRYWNFSTLCRRLLSCIPLDMKYHIHKNKKRDRDHTGFAAALAGAWAVALSFVASETRTLVLEGPSRLELLVLNRS